MKTVQTQFIQVFITTIFLFIAFVSSTQAQIHYDGICRVYGKIQGVSYGAFLNACSTASNDEACQDLLDELERSFSFAVASRQKYVEVNTASCQIALHALKDGIYINIEGLDIVLKKLKGHLGGHCQIDCN